MDLVAARDLELAFELLEQSGWVIEVSNHNLLAAEQDFQTPLELDLLLEGAVEELLLGCIDLGNFHLVAEIDILPDWLGDHSHNRVPLPPHHLYWPLFCQF